jgi:hypothetical protein
VDPTVCCPDGDCLCRKEDPSNQGIFDLTGPYQQEMYAGVTGNVYYPTNAEPPFAGFAVCGGFTNTGILMQGWGPFYASWGIVTVITWTEGADQPSTRGRKLLASIDELMELNENSASPIFGMMSDRYGISGYSMGGGGTTMGTRDRPSLKSGIGLAPWSPVSGMTVPTLFLQGDADFVAGASPPRTASGTPSLQVIFSLYSHFNWFGPDNITGHYALAWNKRYLEGDERWDPWLQVQLTGVASMTHDN